MKEFEVEMRLRNNLLKQRRLELRLKPREMAEHIGIGYPIYLQYEAMTLSPFGLGPGGKGPTRWKPSAKRIAEFFCAGPEELWPDVVLSIKTPRVVKRLEADRVLALADMQNAPMLAPSPEELHEKVELSGTIEVMIEGLSPQEQDILRRRFGLGDDERTETLTEVGSRHGLSRERTRQIQEGALGTLRRSLRSDVDGSDGR